MLNAKSQKTVKKPQNRQWEVSKLSLRCILEIWRESVFFWSEFTKKLRQKLVLVRVEMKFILRIRQ